MIFMGINKTTIELLILIIVIFLLKNEINSFVDFYCK